MSQTEAEEAQAVERGRSCAESQRLPREAEAVESELPKDAESCSAFFTATLPLMAKFGVEELSFKERAELATKPVELLNEGKGKASAGRGLPKLARSSPHAWSTLRGGPSTTSCQMSGSTRTTARSSDASAGIGAEADVDEAAWRLLAEEIDLDGVVPCGTRDKKS
ncbi:unnamed protein product [Effrenium voratum]|uniref:Uncharacterized protein n=1 Tax=Effrenium voratum TaxID=2562239 RepID=A0AA36J5S5_9DINO|nr:unnamed protein product [Effrenium voratum]